MKYIIVFIMGCAWLLFLVGTGTTYLLDKLHDEKKQDKLIFTRTLILVLGVIAMFLFQLNYFYKVDLFIDYRCEYYDSYYNMIFASPRIYSCPEIDIVNEDDVSLTFTTRTTYVGKSNLEGLHLIDVTGIDSDTIVTVDSLTFTSIAYDEDHHIIYYQSNLTEIIQYNDKEIYTSSSKIIDNVYETNAFKTTMSTASIVEETISILDHYSFLPEDFQHVTTYTTNENSLEHPLFTNNGYLIQYTDDASDYVVGVGATGGNFIYNYIDSEHPFGLTEMSNFTSNGLPYYHLLNQVNNNATGTHNLLYILDYKKKDQAYYVLSSKSKQEPNEYFFEEHGTLAFNYFSYEIDGYESIDVMQGIYYTFIPTEYGMKVIDRRSHQFNLFTSIEDQMDSKRLSIMNDEYLDLHDYYKQLVDYAYYVPQIIVNSANPLRLRKLM